MHSDHFTRCTKNEHGPIFVHEADRYGTLWMEMSLSPVHSWSFGA